MRNATLVMSGLAAIGAGIAGGIATHPVPKIPAELDWRQKYRATAQAQPQPVVDDFGYGGAAWPYGLPPLVRARFYADLAPPVDIDVPTPPLERRLPEDPWRPDFARSAAPEQTPDMHEQQDQAGRAAVADALAHTEGMSPYDSGTDARDAAEEADMADEADAGPS